MNSKLYKKWLGKMDANIALDVSDLYEFSRISLKKSRIRKKFNRYYSRYVSDDVILTFNVLRHASSIKSGFDLELKIEPLFTPNVNIVYSDYQYNG